MIKLTKQLKHLFKVYAKQTGNSNLKTVVIYKILHRKGNTICSISVKILLSTAFKNYKIDFIVKERKRKWDISTTPCLHATYACMRMNMHTVSPHLTPVPSLPKPFQHSTK